MQDIAQALRINRNIVECKVYYVSVFRDPAHVLIETLWNVKNNGIYIDDICNIVLIETLWNVKSENSIFAS